MLHVYIVILFIVVITKYISSVLEIDLDRVSGNYKVLQEQLKVAICGAVVKADAYGVGMIPVAKKLAKSGCKHFFVANIDEALELRGLVKHEKIYIFHGILDTNAAKIAFKHKFIPVLNDLYQIEIWNNLGKNLSKKLPAIIHLDTGMGRLSLQVSSIEKILNDKTLTSNISIEYIMSHLACPEQREHPKNNEQLQLMQKYSKLFHNIPISLANSSGIFLGHHYQFDLVRPGCALYGMNPTPYQQAPIKQVVTLKAGILQRKILEKNQTIGYGATHYAQKGDKLLTLEAGYADGYFRNLSNKGRGFYQGKYLPVIGRVSMDMIVVEANSLTEEEFFKINYVELLGDHITVDEVAELAGNIGYEVLTSLGSRYKRRYIG